MPQITQRRDGRAAIFFWHSPLASALVLAAVFIPSSFAQTSAKPPTKKEAKAEVKKEVEIKETLILKNGDTLTGELLSSTGKEIKFKTELAGEVTVELQNIKELKSKREFAVVPKNIKDAKISALVPQGAIKIEEKDVVVSPTEKAETE